MLEHIVKNGESIHDILNMYHIELEEVKSYNLHITDFYNLASGMKIRIPLIHNEIEQILENTESFVQKYYPKVNAFYDEKPQMKEEMTPQIEEPKVQKRDLPVNPLEPVSLPTEHTPPVEEAIKKIEPQPKGRPYPGILPPKNRYGR